jgi:GNAT superfamily N-acetyltransferase
MKVTRVKLEQARDIQKIVQVFGLVFLQEIKDNINNIVVGIEDNEIVGVLISNKKRNKIRDLVVKKQYQGKGYGRQLFEEGRKLINLNMHNMVIRATADDRKNNSVEFWKKMGFEEDKYYETKHGNGMMLMSYKKGSINEWL